MGPGAVEKLGDPPEGAGDSGADGLEEGVGGNGIHCSGQEAEWGVPEPCLLFALFLLSAHFSAGKLGGGSGCGSHSSGIKDPLTPLPCSKTVPDDTARTPPALAYAFLQMHTLQMHTQSPGAASWWALQGVRFTWSVSGSGLAPPLPHGCGRRR